METGDNVTTVGPIRGWPKEAGLQNNKMKCFLLFTFGSKECGHNIKVDA